MSLTYNISLFLEASLWRARQPWANLSLPSRVPLTHWPVGSPFLVPIAKPPLLGKRNASPGKSGDFTVHLGILG